MFGRRRRQQAAAAQQAEAEQASPEEAAPVEDAAPVEEAAPGVSAAPEPAYMVEIEQLNQLKAQGVINDEEFEAKKKQILGL
jgi:hypothetical protein